MYLDWFILFLFQAVVIAQRLHDVTLCRSYDLAQAREQIGELEESSVSMEMYSKLQKQLEDTQARVRELELQVVLEESKALATQES